MGFELDRNDSNLYVAPKSIPGNNDIHNSSPFFSKLFSGLFEEDTTDRGRTPLKGVLMSN